MEERRADGNLILNRASSVVLAAVGGRGGGGGSIVVIAKVVIVVAVFLPVTSHVVNSVPRPRGNEDGIAGVGRDFVPRYMVEAVHMGREEGPSIRRDGGSQHPGVFRIDQRPPATSRELDGHVGDGFAMEAGHDTITVFATVRGRKSTVITITDAVGSARRSSHRFFSPVVVRDDGTTNRPRWKFRWPLLP
jgi:hypothetical protein